MSVAGELSWKRGRKEGKDKLMQCTVTTTSNSQEKKSRDLSPKGFKSISGGGGGLRWALGANNRKCRGWLCGERRIFFGESEWPRGIARQVQGDLDS